MQKPYMTLIFEDSHGRRTRKNIEMDTQVTLVDYQAVVTAFTTALNTITDLELVDVSMTLPATGTFAGAANSNVDVGATFSGVLYDKQGAKASFKIPGIVSTYADSAGNIDVEDTDIAAVLAFFVNATPYDLLLSDGETMDHWVSGSLDS